MKRKLILILAFSVCLLTNCQSFALETNSSDYQIVNDNSSTVKEESSNYTVKQETDNLLFVEKNKKLGVINKATGEYILDPIADKITQFNDDNFTEYKIKVNDNTGYLNTGNNVAFLSDYDDMYLTGSYIKVKKDNKFGFFDKKGNLILKPVYEDVGIIKNSESEYLTAKYNGETRFFDKKGKFIPEDELYTVKENKAIILVRDLKPIIKEYRRKNNIIYRTANKENNKIIDIPKIDLKEKPQIASVEKHIKPAADNKYSDNNILTINKKNYILVRNNDKLGLKKENGKEIIPAINDFIDVKKPGKHFSSPVIAAKKHKSYALYDLKGKLLAEQVYDKVNVYRYGRVYSYKFDDGKWILSENNKIIGTITLNKDKSYEFVKTGFRILSLNKINELFITLLTI